MKRLPAIIIARGGSIRLPRKNVLPFCGRPLVAWSIIQARMAEFPTDVILATDDDELMEIGAEYGAQLIRRPKMRDDITGGLIHTMVLRELFDRGWDIDAFVGILPTSVLRKPGDIDDMIYHWRLGDGTPATTMIRLKDIVLYERCDTLNIVQDVMFDNTGRYSISVLGMHCIDARVWMDFHMKGRRYAHTTDKLEEYEKRFASWHIPVYVEPWQRDDIDYQHEFDLSEWYFERMGLRKIYNDWWKENGKRRKDQTSQGSTV